VCEAAGSPYVDQAATSLLEHSFKPRTPRLHACPPRNLVQLLEEAARYRRIAPALSRDLLDPAYAVFLVGM
jgi:hypothetical protein